MEAWEMESVFYASVLQKTRILRKESTRENSEEQERDYGKQKERERERSQTERLTSNERR